MFVLELFFRFLVIKKNSLINYRLNFSKAISYRGNAGTAITQAINGTADMQSRKEEATKSVELSDKYMLQGVATLATLEQNL